jgi:hypothetical protein
MLQFTYHGSTQPRKRVSLKSITFPMGDLHAVATRNASCSMLARLPAYMPTLMQRCVNRSIRPPVQSSPVRLDTTCEADVTIPASVRQWQFLERQLQIYFVGKGIQKMATRVVETGSERLRLAYQKLEWFTTTTSHQHPPLTRRK